MGRFDTSTIDGFDSMSAEDKVSALLGAEIPDAVDMNAFVERSMYDKLKSANDKNSSELASLKKEMNARMTDEERIKAEADTSRQELEEKYNALLKETTLAKYTAKYVSQGYDEKLAKETAQALMDGDMDKVFACGEKYRDALTKSLKAETLKDTPRPIAGNGSGESNDVPVEIGIAQNIGKTTAAYNKVASDVLSKYL